MNFQKSIASKSSFIVLIILATALVAFAQGNDSTVVYDDSGDPLAVAVRNNLYCAGYIQRGSFNTKYEIVGANDEKEKHIYAQGDNLYINVGAVDGIKVGDMFSVIRPRGKFKSKWSKKNNLGVFVEEVGAVEVTNVMREVSVAKVKTSCGEILFGDLVTPVPNRVSPMFKQRPALDIFATSSGKSKGRILKERYGAELLSAEKIVYIDLGREDGVQAGSYLTIYRPLGTGDIYEGVLEENINNETGDFESKRYRGGGYSIDSTRKKGSDGDGETVTTENAKSRRPDGLRQVVGELIILNVMEKTATAIIVRNASEIHTGDWVELQ